RGEPGPRPAARRLPRGLRLRPLDAATLGGAAVDRLCVLGADEPGALLVGPDRPRRAARGLHRRLPGDRPPASDRHGALARLPPRARPVALSIPPAPVRHWNERGNETMRRGASAPAVR